MKYSWSNYTALIAEDDPLNYRYMQLLLERRSDINLIWAKDGLETINEFESNKNIDIVLLDLQLPHVDGIKALEIIKMQNPFLPVIIQTANAWNNEDEVCAEAGCDGFFTKPIDMDGMLERMEDCLTTYYTLHKTPVIQK